MGPRKTHLCHTPISAALQTLPFCAPPQTCHLASSLGGGFIRGNACSLWTVDLIKSQKSHGMPRPKHKTIKMDDGQKKYHTSSHCVKAKESRCQKAENAVPPHASKMRGGWLGEKKERWLLTRLSTRLRNPLMSQPSSGLPLHWQASPPRPDQHKPWLLLKDSTGCSGHSLEHPPPTNPPTEQAPQPLTCDTSPQHTPYRNAPIVRQHQPLRARTQRLLHPERAMIAHRHPN